MIKISASSSSVCAQTSIATRHGKRVASPSSASICFWISELASSCSRSRTLLSSLRARNAWFANRSLSCETARLSALHATRYASSVERACLALAIWFLSSCCFLFGLDRIPALVSRLSVPLKRGVLDITTSWIDAFPRPSTLPISIHSIMVVLFFLNERNPPGRNLSEVYVEILGL